MREYGKAVPSKAQAVKKPLVYQQQFGLIIICKGEREQARLYRRLVKLGLTVKVVCV